MPRLPGLDARARFGEVVGPAAGNYARTAKPVRDYLIGKGTDPARRRRCPQTHVPLAVPTEAHCLAPVTAWIQRTKTSESVP